MSDTVIKIENLSKRYIIGHETGAPYLTFRDVLADSFKKINPVNRKNKETSSKEEFWALKDINLEIKQGEKIGIIGRNGAGKSTLLKVLSRITEPTTGSIRIKGRIASLLEVGTGFHPELTGRENIFLNGAILGMRKDEIKMKFDEIVDFSGVEKFLDTPVKRYSSGMYVRLAFAVAAHLEPEILLIDEVLAVGDAEFQKKCLGKMDDVAKQGRTIVFVSHNMGALRQLCERGVLLVNGKIDKTSNVEDVINTYLKSDINVFNNHTKEKRYSEFAIRGIKIVNKKGDAVNTVLAGDDFGFIIAIKGIAKDKRGVVNIGIYNVFEEKILHLSSLHYKEIRFTDADPVLNCYIRKNLLQPGNYYINISLLIDEQKVEYIQRAFTFNVISGSFFKNGNENIGRDARVFVESEWSVNYD